MRSLDPQGAHMKTIFDASFRYTPSFETDVRKTFERLRRERLAQERRYARAPAAAPLAPASRGADDLLAHVGDLAGARGAGAAGAVAVACAGAVGAARANDARSAG